MVVLPGLAEVVRLLRDVHHLRCCTFSKRMNSGCAKDKMVEDTCGLPGLKKGTGRTPRRLVVSRISYTAVVAVAETCGTSSVLLLSTKTLHQQTIRRFSKTPNNLTMS